MNIRLNRVIALSFCLMCLTGGALYADGSVDELRPIDLNGDGKPEKVSLIYSEPDDYGNCSAVLKVVSLGKVYTVQLKDGFNADTTYLKKLILSDKIRPFIMVEATMNKNKNRWIYSFDGRKLKEELVVFSNFPLIYEKDIDKDNAKEIVVKLKDDRPGRDPSKDTYERTYKWTGTRFYDNTDDWLKNEAIKTPKPQPSGDDDY